MVLMFGLLDRSIALVRAVPFGRYLRVGLLLAVAIWLQEPAFDVGLAASKRGREGAGGYNTVRWRESQTIEFVKHLSFSAERVIYTNDPDAIYILAHLAARLPPRKTYFRSSEPARSISDFTGSWPEEGEGLLVWFPHEGRENFFAPSELQSIATLDTLALLQDGAVYSVSARK
jgi:hypothetical protein